MFKLSLVLAARALIAALALSAAIAFAGAVGTASAQEKPPQEKVRIVASFSILADFVRQVGGERVMVTALVGPESDAHVYTPSPADVKFVADAKLVVINGLGFEGWFDRLVAASGKRPLIAVATKGVKLITSEDQNHASAGAKGDGHKHGTFDPHAWQDIGNARFYVTNIRDALTNSDPDGKSFYDANTSAYLKELDTIQEEVVAALATIPKERRKIITTHDAFRYFASAHGLTITAPQGVSTEGEASAKDVGRIIRQIKTEKVPAVFLENVTNEKLMQRIAAESGARIGGRLYSDSLSAPGGPAATYVAMMRNNVRLLVEALR
jgi:zinc/manganese transport system substrate-binding protein